MNNLTDDKCPFSRYAEFDPEGAFARFENGAGRKLAPSLALTVGELLGRHDFERALKLVRNGVLADGSASGWWMGLAAAAADSLFFGNNASKAALALTHLEDTHAKAAFLSDMKQYDEQLDPKESFETLLELTRAEDSKVRSALNAHLIRELLTSRPKLIKQDPATAEASPDEFAAGAVVLARSQGFAGALAWASALPEGAHSERALQTTIRQWLEFDSMQAGRAIASKEPGSERDLLVSELVRHLYRHGNSSEAAEWKKAWDLIPGIQSNE